MSYLDYYQFQAKARGIHTADDVRQNAASKAFVYENLVLRWLPKDRTAKMADLACGHGSFLYWLRENGYQEPIGVDSSSEQIHRARSAGLKVAEANVMSWLEGQDDKSFRVLFAIDFVEHISKDDMMRFLKNCHRVLQDDGVLILRYPNGDSPLVGLNLFNDITHVWTYTSNCLDSLARMHGYSKTHFIDEGYQAARDLRWLKVPLGRFSAFLLRFLFQSVSREKVVYWNSSMWAALHK